MGKNNAFLKKLAHFSEKLDENDSDLITLLNEEKNKEWLLPEGLVPML